MRRLAEERNDGQEVKNKIPVMKNKDYATETARYEGEKEHEVPQQVNSPSTGESTLALKPRVSLFLPQR